MSRIKLQDSMSGIVFKMSEGNPGAMTVCMQVLEKADKIDPQSMIGSVAPLLSLDNLNIYGSKIWVYVLYAERK